MLFRSFLIIWFSFWQICILKSSGELLVCVGKEVGLGVGVGVSEGVGLGEGEGLGVCDGVGVGLLVATPLSQISFLPLLIQVNFNPL